MRPALAGLAVGCLCALWSCAPTPGSLQPGASAAEPVQPEPLRRAVAWLRPASGSDVSAQVSFQLHGGAVEVHVQAMGLAPGDHGFHVHETGDCSAPDASSAGEHFNPGAASHGAPGGDGRHAGDLGNLHADESGFAQASFVDHALSLEGDESIIGRAVVIHERRDDLLSQPGGDAGARVACGVIEADH